MLSILTATFNRANCLEKLYKSIVRNQKSIVQNIEKSQKSTAQNRENSEKSILRNREKSKLEAEWIIIDDGSTDKTKTIVKQFIAEKKIKIKYVYQQNSGKMAAINKAVEFATGELIVDCDSDDFFSENAFKIIKQNASKLLENPQLYALCFLKQDFLGNISGKKFPSDNMKSTMFDLYFKQDIEGEKILVFNARVRKKFRHELEKNENFITEARMYHKMDEKYKILCINEVLEIGDYKEDGYTKNISKTFKTSPNGYYKYFKEILQKDLKGVLFKKKIYVLKHFVLFWILKKYYTNISPE